MEEPFRIVVAIVAIAVLVFCDWTENLIHLNQLNTYKGTVDDYWIAVASIATRMTLTMFAAVSMTVVLLAAWTILREVTSQANTMS